ncbi:hypothetical protein ABDD95_11275 [Mucilaginibacter sp. PAMB04274]|uniref:hypothetical protein n=1 Tax=Mucilaginibacter sp. PAMB04274 TaxID=3138568 RepID=UPI0031F63B77
MAIKTYLDREAKAWLKRKKGPDEILRIVPDRLTDGHIPNYALFTAFDENPEYLGCILFDAKGYWIYDGDILSVTEQEQVAKFIINYTERL